VNARGNTEHADNRVPFKFLFVPLRDSAAAEAELNGFLAQHRVLAVERQWVDQGAQSGWAVLLECSN